MIIESYSGEGWHAEVHKHANRTYLENIKSDWASSDCGCIDPVTHRADNIGVTCKSVTDEYSAAGKTFTVTRWKCRVCGDVIRPETEIVKNTENIRVVDVHLTMEKGMECSTGDLFEAEELGVSIPDMGNFDCFMCTVGNSEETVFIGWIRGQ